MIDASLKCGKLKCVLREKYNKSVNYSIKYIVYNTEWSNLLCKCKVMSYFNRNREDANL